MTVDSSMSSGYCSLDEELEDCFFTAKTTFFRNVQSKQPSKVNMMITSTFKGGNKLGGLRGKLASSLPQQEPCVGRAASGTILVSPALTNSHP